MKKILKVLSNAILLPIFVAAACDDTDINLNKDQDVIFQSIILDIKPASIYEKLEDAQFFTIAMAVSFKEVLFDDAGNLCGWRMEVDIIDKINYEVIDKADIVVPVEAGSGPEIGKLYFLSGIYKGSDRFSELRSEYSRINPGSCSSIMFMIDEDYINYISEYLALRMNSGSEYIAIPAISVSREDISGRLADYIFAVSDTEGNGMFFRGSSEFEEESINNKIGIFSKNFYYLDLFAVIGVFSNYEPSR